MEYLGFELHHNFWKPSQSKIAALDTLTVKNLKDLRSFLGALNFLRRHVKNFTYTSTRLTDLLKKDVKWTWGPEEESAVEELKEKVRTAVPLGVPRSTGEILMITDASDLGGGATIWQWQAIDPTLVKKCNKHD